MELDQLLTTFDKVDANLTKLERIWQRAEPLLPDGPHVGTTPEYVMLARTWHDLLPGLLPIDGWTITESLPDMDELGRTFLEYFQVSELPVGAWEAAAAPGKALAEYRYRLDRARRRAVASRLTELKSQVGGLLQSIVVDLPPRLVDPDMPPASSTKIATSTTDEVGAAIAEIERLLGDTVERQGRWSDLHRHLHFGEVHDWHDIVDMDWPSVLRDIEAAQVGDTEPLPVPDIDLGTAASSTTGRATTALNWEALEPDKFERLLFNLFQQLEGYQNVQWLMKTNAPDRGRDLSMERVIHDSGGSSRTERVFAQAKHYTSKSVGPTDIAESLGALSVWEPPIIRTLIIATSGRFTSDAVAVAERHNEAGKLPYIELWSDSRLESLLSMRPALAVTYRLRA